MISCYVAIEDILHGWKDSESRKWIEKISCEAEDFFAKMGFTWSGTTPDRLDIEFRLERMVEHVIQSLGDDPDKKITTVSAGRLAVQGTRSTDGKIRLEVLVQYNLGMGTEASVQERTPKLIELIGGRNHERVSVWKGTYENGNLALQLVCEDFDGQPSDWIAGEPYGKATVNLVSEPTPPSNQAYLDTNNMPEILDVLLKAGAGIDTGQRAESGWHKYPLFAFRKEWLESVPEVGSEI